MLEFPLGPQWIIVNDVGDNVMLVIWCWWQNHYVGDFSNELNRSLTSWIGHQHLKLVTNTFRSNIRHQHRRSLLFCTNFYRKWNYQKTHQDGKRLDFTVFCCCKFYEWGRPGDSISVGYWRILKIKILILRQRFNLSSQFQV